LQGRRSNPAEPVGPDHSPHSPIAYGAALFGIRIPGMRPRSGSCRPRRLECAARRPGKGPGRRHDARRIHAVASRRCRPLEGRRPSPGPAGGRHRGRRGGTPAGQDGRHRCRPAPELCRAAAARRPAGPSPARQRPRARGPGRDAAAELDRVRPRLPGPDAPRRHAGDGLAGAPVQRDPALRAGIGRRGLHGPRRAAAVRSPPAGPGRAA
jgi:hypothetical protein